MPNALSDYTSNHTSLYSYGGWRCILYYITITLLLISTDSTAQDSIPMKRMRVVSYNVENLFDTIDDPLTADSEFLPGSEIDWTQKKYKQKIATIAGVISDIGAWDYPALIGLIEVENSDVISDLVKHPKIRRQDYRQAVSNAADPRGIDVALLWHPRHFTMIKAYEIPHYGPLLYYPYMRDSRSYAQRQGTGRNTLWVKLREKTTGQIFDVFVVHLPSRRGGVNATSHKRILVTRKIAKVISALQKQQEDAHIIVMGDFNDNPSNRPVKNGFSTIDIDQKDSICPTALYNLGTKVEKQHRGTHYFGHKLWLPDQFIVSGTLLSPHRRITIKSGEMKIFSPPNMQIDGHPRRSFRGKRYTGGFSDHFPIYIDLTISKTKR